MKLKEKWSKLSKPEKIDLLVRIGLPAFVITSVLGLTKCNSESLNKLDGKLISRGGKLILVDVEDDKKNIVIKDSDGSKLDYNFDSNTLALLSPKDIKLSKRKEYEVVLFDNDGNITFGYMDGIYLSDTILDALPSSDLEYSKYYVNDIDGISLYTDGNKPSLVLENNSEVLGTKLDESKYKIVTINNKKIISTDLDSSKINIEKNNLKKEIKKDEYYISCVDLNIRDNYIVDSEPKAILNVDTKVKRNSDIEPYNDGIYEWIYVTYYNPVTSLEEEGWVAKRKIDTNEDYLVSERDYSNMDITSQLKSVAGIALDVNTGQILFDKNAFEQMYPASITKVLTAYLVFKYGNLDDYIEYTERSVSVEGHKSEGYSTYFPEIVKLGNKISVYDALRISLLKSDNSTTVALAEYVENITGRNFSELMNEEAQNIGCKKCNFTNSYGYEDTQHHVSALDMAKITSYIYKNKKEVIDIMGTRDYTFNFNGEEYHLVNDSVIFGINEYAIGSKTGYTDAAGQTMITVFEKDGNVIVTVTLKGSGRDSKNLDADLLARSSFYKLENNTKIKALN